MASKAHCVNTQGRGQQLKMKEAGMLPLCLPSVSTNAKNQLGEKNEMKRFWKCWKGKG